MLKLDRWQVDYLSSVCARSTRPSPLSSSMPRRMSCMIQDRVGAWNGSRPTLAVVILFQESGNRDAIVAAGQRSRAGSAVLADRCHQLFGALGGETIISGAQASAGSLALMLEAEAPIYAKMCHERIKPTCSRRLSVGGVWASDSPMPA